MGRPNNKGNNDMMPQSEGMARVEMEEERGDQREKRREKSKLTIPAAGAGEHQVTPQFLMVVPNVPLPF